MNPDIYSRKPLKNINGIPVFSKQDRYTQNYEKISEDHLQVFLNEGRNPFMKEDHIVECETSTEDLVRKYTKTNDIILDVGVGMGRILSKFPELKRYGLDISFKYLEYAQKQGIDVCYSRIEDMPYKLDIFDLVVCTDVLEHVLDLSASLAKIISVMKSEGILIIRVPYKEDLEHYLDPTYPYQYVHLRNFDENNLRLLFERVHNLAWVESSFTGYTRGYLKFRFFSKKIDRLLSYAFCNLFKFYKPLYNFVKIKLHQPLEINVVLRKKIL
ncbi:MAG TPA: class I SAM-dependent methyltransferase [Bacteroidetes bacterium]|nr:class I SAM-dependent methyltransferase [Bacteroidota bacterium]